VNVPHTAAPFLKWAGGKGQLLKQYKPFFPTEPLRGYFEPFVGSGAVFFHLRGRGLFERYHLAENNNELINCYRVVRDQIDDLIFWLRVHQSHHCRSYYYTVRNWDHEPDWLDAPRPMRAARMIYLNKTCYNGLWRVNSKGHFNVPAGRYRNPTILDEDRLRAASQALQGVELEVMDFERVIRLAGRGDFVYLDPPYFPLSETANFTSYSQDAFGEYEHRKLALVFAELDRKGCRVMLSNSDTPLVRELYRDFRVETMIARRAINSARARRGPITEVVVVNYE
jgi:DNA adenine methylase